MGGGIRTFNVRDARLPDSVREGVKALEFLKSMDLSGLDLPDLRQLEGLSDMYLISNDGNGGFKPRLDNMLSAPVIVQKAFARFAVGVTSAFDVVLAASSSGGSYDPPGSDGYAARGPENDWMERERTFARDLMAAGLVREVRLEHGHSISLEQYIRASGLQIGLISLLYQYLTAPLIIYKTDDIFNEKILFTAFLRSKETEDPAYAKAIDEFHRRNALREKNLYYLVSDIDLAIFAGVGDAVIRDKLQAIYDEAKRLSETTGTGSLFAHMSLDEKIAAVKALKEKVYEFLTFLTNYQP